MLFLTSTLLSISCCGNHSNVHEQTLGSNIEYDKIKKAELYIDNILLRNNESSIASDLLDAHLQELKGIEIKTDEEPIVRSTPLYSLSDLYELAEKDVDKFLDAVAISKDIMFKEKHKFLLSKNELTLNGYNTFFDEILISVKKNKLSSFEADILISASKPIVTIQNTQNSYLKN